MEPWRRPGYGLPRAWAESIFPDRGAVRNPLVPPVSHGHPTIPIFPREVSAFREARRIAEEAILREHLRNLQSRARRLAQDVQDLRDEQRAESLALIACRRLLQTWTNPTIWIQDEKKQIRMQIEATSTAKLAPKLNETELIQKLVCHG